MARNLAGIARERTVMTTIADVIVAAAAGKNLRVAVGCTHPDEITFADQLTRALHARGRPCRCLPPRPGPAVAACSAGPSRVSGPIVAVITSGTADLDETDLCRIDIRLDIPAAPDLPADDQPDVRGRRLADDHQPDIVVDYRDADGPVIRHIAPALTPPPTRL